MRSDYMGAARLATDALRAVVSRALPVDEATHRAMVDAACRATRRETDRETYRATYLATYLAIEEALVEALRDD